MKINLEAQDIKYSIEMDAQEMRAGSENLKDLIVLLLDKKYEILSLVKEIKNLKESNKTSTTKIPSSLLNENKECE